MSDEEKSPINKLWEKIYKKWPNEKKKSCVIKEEDAKITNFWGEDCPPSKAVVYVSTDNITAGIFPITPLAPFAVIVPTTVVRTCSKTLGSVMSLGPYVVGSRFPV